MGLTSRQRGRFLPRARRCLATVCSWQWLEALRCLQVRDVVVNSASTFPCLATSSVSAQNNLPASQSPARMRRSSLTPRASADTEQRPRHHSVGSKPPDPLGPFPFLEARGGSGRPRLPASVQVVPCLCYPSPATPSATAVTPPWCWPWLESPAGVWDAATDSPQKSCWIRCPV